MRITVTMPSTGIFYAPGLAKPVAIDTKDLDSSVAAKLERLAADARLFANADATPEASGQSSDMQETVIAVEEGGKERLIRVSDQEAIQDPSLRAFIDLVQEQANLARRKGLTE
jgi:hypothetical protein